MKKYLGIIGLGALSLVLTGCGGEIKKTMVCTKNDEDLSGVETIKSEILLKYEGEQMIEGKENVYLTLPEDYTPDMIENVKENLELQYENSDLNVKSWKTEVDGHKISVLTEMDLDNMSDSEIDNETSYDDAKTILEERGYTCK